MTEFQEFRKPMATLQWMKESHKQQQENHRLIQEQSKNNTKKLGELYEILKAYRDHVFARTIIVQIHWEIYPISCKELDMVFSRFGILEYVEKLSPEMGFHSKIRFKTEDSALQALNFLNGKNIYDGCCRLELSIEVPPEKSKKIECSTHSQIGVDNPTHLEADVDRLTLGDSSDLSTSKMKADLCGFEPPVEYTTLKIVRDPIVQVEKESLPNDDHTFIFLEGTKLQSTLMEECTIGINHSDLVDNLVLNDIPPTDSSSAQLQVMSNSSLEAVDFVVKFEELDKVVVDHVNPTAIGLSDAEMSSTKNLGIFDAHNMFVKMPKQESEANVNGWSELSSKLRKQLPKTLFVIHCQHFIDFMSMLEESSFVFDPGKSTEFFWHSRRISDTSRVEKFVYNCFGVLRESCRDFERLIFVFDLGGNEVH